MGKKDVVKSMLYFGNIPDSDDNIDGELLRYGAQNVCSILFARDFERVNVPIVDEFTLPVYRKLSECINKMNKDECINKMNENLSAVNKRRVTDGFNYLSRMAYEGLII